MTLAADILGFHTNPINLGVNAEFAAKSKTQPKGNKKRSRQMMMTTTAATTTMHNNNSEAPLLMPSSSTLLRRSGGRSNNCNNNNNQNNQGPEDDENENDDDDDNLNVASGNVRSKSTSKFFEALKENVRCEVSNLIETNDLRPYFLIQLFRDLQLMSSSDSTRHQTLQSIQNMYNRYVESTIQEEAMFGGGQRVEQPQLRRGQADEEEEDVDGDEDEDRQNLSHDEFDNRMLVNDLRMEAKTENDLATQNREARSRRDNQAEDSLRRQNKRRYRNRVNEIASKQNFLGQRLGLGFLPGTSSASSQQSTPIVSGYFLFNIIQ